MKVSRELNLFDKIINIRAINIFLRTSTLGTRFLFVIFLAKYLDQKSVGYYSLFTATIGYFLYIVGLDFYTFSTREILKCTHDHRGQMIKGHAFISLLMCIAVIPFAILTLSMADWPSKLVIWFIPILILENVNQEISRLLVTLSEQVTSSLILFLRQGSWALAIAGLMYMDVSLRNLDAVMACWLVASFTAALIGINKLKKLNIGGWQLPVNWQWLKSGVKISSIFLLASLVLRGVQTIDRYWLQSLTNLETVGPYVLFLSIASTLSVFMEAGAFSFTYPEILNLFLNKNYRDGDRKVKKLLINSLIVSMVFGAVSWLILPVLLDWINKPLYLEMKNLYPFLILATALNVMSMIPNFALYALNKDSIIVKNNIIGALVFVVVVLAVSGYSKIFAVPVGLISFYGYVLISNFIVYLNMTTVLCKLENDE